MFLNKRISAIEYTANNAHFIVQPMGKKQPKQLCYQYIEHQHSRPIYVARDIGKIMHQRWLASKPVTKISNKLPHKKMFHCQIPSVREENLPFGYWVFMSLTLLLTCCACDIKDIPGLFIEFQKSSAIPDLYPICWN